MKSILVSIVAAVVLVGCKSISIHQAVFDGNIEAVKQHLDAGAEVDAKDDKFVGTFLHWAAAGGQNEIVELLIAKGADVNATDGDGDTPFASCRKLNGNQGNRRTANKQRCGCECDESVAAGATNRRNDSFRYGDTWQSHRNRRPPPQTRRQDKCRVES